MLYYPLPGVNPFCTGALSFFHLSTNHNNQQWISFLISRASRARITPVKASQIRLYRGKTICTKLIQWQRETLQSNLFGLFDEKMQFVCSPDQCEDADCIQTSQHVNVNGEKSTRMFDNAEITRHAKTNPLAFKMSAAF